MVDSTANEIHKLAINLTVTSMPSSTKQVIWAKCGVYGICKPLRPLVVFPLYSCATDLDFHGL